MGAGGTNVRLREGLAGLCASMFPGMPHCFQPAGTHSEPAGDAALRLDRGRDGAQRHTGPPTRRTPSGSAM